MSVVFRSLAHLLSAITHPMLMIAYMFIFYYIVNPYLFSTSERIDILFMKIFIPSVFLPLSGILLLLGVGFIDSLDMKDKSERIGPLMMISIMYLWVYLNIRTNASIPIPYAIFVLGALISTFIAFFINNFSKISLHAIGLGGLLAGLLSLLANHGQEYFHFSFNQSPIALHYVLLLAILFFIIGATLTARLYLKAHNIQDVIGGFMVGIIGQLIAMMFFWFEER